MNRIICVGNRFVDQDAGGCRVHDLLQSMPLPEQVEVIDGGLAGLDLLRQVEGATRVIFVDSVGGFGPGSEPVVFAAAEAAAGTDSRYDHASGLGYLLRVIPAVLEEAPDQVIVVGIRESSNPAAIQKAAALSLRLATQAESETVLSEAGGTQGVCES